ncbi:MAG: HEAT repeat domain-containing protein [Planctomycetaceae bacterium]|nr:HEAT repeat domain-containing protein [Planctomycetaceae bacterium]
MLDQAFEALKTYDYGTPISELQGIEDAMVAAHADPAVRQDLEQHLIAALGSDISRDAKDYVCRKLAGIGTPAAVPALSKLLPIEANSHLARHALERIPGPEALAALATAAKELSGKLKIGAIGSLGARGDSSSVATLASLLNDADPAVARSAAMSLGLIGGSEATAVLQSAIQTGTGDKDSLIDALLECAESLVRSKQTVEAKVIYESLSGDQQPRLIRLAATRGLLACGARTAAS